MKSMIIVSLLCTFVVAQVQGQSHLTPGDFEAATNIDFRSLQLQYKAENRSSIQLLDPKRHEAISPKAVRHYFLESNKTFLHLV